MNQPASSFSIVRHFDLVICRQTVGELLLMVAPRRRGQSSPFAETPLRPSPARFRRKSTAPVAVASVVDIPAGGRPDSKRAGRLRRRARAGESDVTRLRTAVKTSSSSRHGSSEVVASTVKRNCFAATGANRSTDNRGLTAWRNAGRPRLSSSLERRAGFDEIRRRESVGILALTVAAPNDFC